MTSFRLNGQLLAVAEELARPVGLTAAWWQVLGAALGEPQSVSEIARAMGLTRQSVQRIADLLVERGLAAYADNPAHRRAKLVHAHERRPQGGGGDQPGAPRSLAEALVAEMGPPGWPRCWPGCTSCRRRSTGSRSGGPSRRTAASTTAS